MCAHTACFSIGFKSALHKPSHIRDPWTVQLLFGARVFIIIILDGVSYKGIAAICEKVAIFCCNLFLVSKLC